MKLTRIAPRSSSPRLVLLPLAFLLLAILLPPSQAQEPDAKEPLVLGTRHIPPFVLREADGSWSGLTVELWQRVAEDLDLEYEFREVSLADSIPELEAGRIDAVVAALTITADREERIDFTHPFLNTGLGIATVPEEISGLRAVLRLFATGEFLASVLFLVVALLGAGFLAWLFERRRNAEQFGGGPVRGVLSGLWWSAVTLTTVGYGDKAPRTAGGRLVAVAWMLASIFIISAFTAAMTSTLTASQLGDRVRGPEDLPGLLVGTTSGSTSELYLARREVRSRGYASPKEALQALAAGEIDAVVYDAPILRYQAEPLHDRGVRVLDAEFERQAYGIALPSGSELREPINRSLLHHLASPEWLRLRARYHSE